MLTAQPRPASVRSVVPPLSAKRSRRLSSFTALPCSAAQQQQVTLLPTARCTGLAQPAVLALPSFTAGSSDVAELKLASVCTAAVHARFDWTGGRLFVTDLDSAGGTTYDGNRIMPGVRYLVGSGAVIAFGGAEAEVLIEIGLPPPSSAMDALLVDAFKAKFAHGSAEVQAALRELDGQ